MAIIRSTKPSSNFYILDKSISEDKRLSWAARGMLIFLLGKPDSWSVSPANLVNETRQAIGKSSARDAVHGLIKELEEAGYIRRERSRSGATGCFNGFDYIVSERHATKEEKQESSPQTGFPDTGFPDTANPTLISTERTLSTDDKQKHITSIPAEVDQQQPKTEIVKDMFGSEERKASDKVCPWEEILDIWAEVMPDKPQPVRGLWPESKRATDLANRWKLGFSLRKESNGELFYTDRESGLDWWRRFFQYMRRSDFLMGNTAAVGQRAFTLKIDWVVNKTNFVKIMENTYHR